LLRAPKPPGAASNAKHREEAVAIRARAWLAEAEPREAGKEDSPVNALQTVSLVGTPAACSANRTFVPEPHSCRPSHSPRSTSHCILTRDSHSSRIAPNSLKTLSRDIAYPERPGACSARLFSAAFSAVIAATRPLRYNDPFQMATTLTEILLHNTLTNKIEPLAPIHPGEVHIYTCGPTVYSFAHIGNFRTFVFQDVLRRFFRLRGLRVLQVMNITDVDDRIIHNAAAAGVSIREYTEKYVKAFLEDIDALHIEMPEELVRATDHIDDMVALIEKLQQKGLTYKSDGSVYFRISKFPSYGKLSKIDLSGMQAGARVDVDQYEKDDARDFALWKAPKPGEHFWETRIGPGRPGWHIECSAMAMKYLGDTIDIHTGGVDLAFPHHENEIAQSESATGKPFVKFWLHAEHLIINGQKMSKSLGNFYTLRDLFAKGYKPSTIRFLLLSVPYRRQLNFTEDGLLQAKNSVERLRNFFARLKTEQFAAGSNPDIHTRIEKAEADFDAGLADDVNAARALAAVFDLVRDVNAAMDRREFLQQDAPRAVAAMEKFDTVLALLADDDDEKLRGLGIAAATSQMQPAQIEALIAERTAAKSRRDFKRSDEIRQQLADSGILVEDTKDGTVRWKYK
jgi:cysteinyl-tRNA synthetase